MQNQKNVKNLTTLCYVEKDGCYLMMHRISKKNDVNKDKWIGIGGHFLENESPEECLLREAKEETGLTLTNYRLRGIVTFICDKLDHAEYMHLFTASGFTGNISECDEGVLEWIDKKVLYDLTLWEGDKIFLDLISKECPFFSLKLEYQGDNLIYAALDGKEIIKR